MPNQLVSPKLLTTGGQQADPLPNFDAVAVTPSDSVDLPSLGCRGLYVTGAGNVAVNLSNGGTAVYTGLAAGQIIRGNISRVLATLTTATGILALY